MTKELITRGPFKDDKVTVEWMLASGQVTDHVGPRAVIRDGIQLYVPGDGGRVVEVDMGVHEAGDLHQAIEAHMENVAAHEVKPITPEERDRALRKDWRKSNLKAVRDELAISAAEQVRSLWLDGLQDKSPDVAERTIEIIRSWFPQLADALDDLANGGPS